MKLSSYDSHLADTGINLSRGYDREILKSLSRTFGFQL